MAMMPLPQFSHVDARMFDKEGQPHTRCWWCYFDGDPSGTVVREA